MLFGGLTVGCPLTLILRDAVTLGGRMSVKLSKYSSCEWALLKRFLRSEVKGQGQGQGQGQLIYNGGGIHFASVTSRLTRESLVASCCSYNFCMSNHTL